MFVVQLSILDLWNDLGSLFADLMSKAGDLGEWVLSMFPDSPFKLLTSVSNGQYGKYFSYLNYFINIGGIIYVVNLWIACVTAYYLWMLVARWAKLLE